MQAKDIPEVPVLQFLESLNGSPATWLDNEGLLFDNSVQHGMPSGVPAKVVLAKMAAMIRKGLVEGCACGCRGNFLLTHKGRTMLAEASMPTSN